MSDIHIVILAACTLVCVVSAALCYWSVGVLREVGADVSKYLKARVEEEEENPNAQ